MFKLNRSGYVNINGVFAGIISEHIQELKEQYVFQYDNQYIATGSPIGYHFPVTEQPYVFDALPPFFANLVSEGWLRSHQSKKSRLDKDDSFGLLLANGKELIGAVPIIAQDIS